MPAGYRNVGGVIVPEYIAQRAPQSVPVNINRPSIPSPSRTGGGGSTPSTGGSTSPSPTPQQEVKTEPTPPPQSDNTDSFIGAGGRVIKYGETPFEREFRAGTPESAARQKFLDVVHYNPEGVQASLAETDPKAVTSKFTEAAQSPIVAQRKEEEQKTQFYQRAAISDFVNAGLLQYSRQGELELTPRGQNLGTEKFYALEQGAIFGKSLDFLIENNGKVGVYPEGTRQLLTRTGLETPLFITSGGKQYALAQTTGGETISVQELNPFGYRLEPAVTLNTREIFNITQKEGTISYSLKGSELGVNLSTMQVIEEQYTQKSIDTTAPFEFAPLATPIPFAQYFATDEEIVAYEMGKSTPLKEIYRFKLAEPLLKKPLEKGENITGLYIPTQEYDIFFNKIKDVRVSGVVGYVAEIPETMFKSIVAVGQLGGMGLLAATGKTKELSLEHRATIAGEFGEGIPYLASFPFTVSTLTAYALTPAKGAVIKTRSVFNLEATRINKPEPFTLDPRKGISEFIDVDLRHEYYNYFIRRGELPPPYFTDLPSRILEGGQKVKPQIFEYVKTEAPAPVTSGAEGLKQMYLTRFEKTGSLEYISPIPSFSGITSQQYGLKQKQRERQTSEERIRVLAIPEFKVISQQVTLEKIKTSERQKEIQREIQRQNETQRTGIRQQFKFETGLKTRTREDLFFYDFQLEKLRVPERQIIRQKLTTRQLNPPRENVKNPPITIPLLVLPFEEKTRETKPYAKTKNKSQKFGYTPSLVGILVGGRSLRTQKIFTGLEIRGVR